MVKRFNHYAARSNRRIAQSKKMSPAEAEANLSALAVQWLDQKHIESEARLERRRIENLMLAGMNLLTDDKTVGEIPAARLELGLLVYRNPSKIRIGLFDALCKRLGLDPLKIAPPGRRMVNLAVWNQLTPEQRGALTLALDNTDRGFSFAPTSLIED